MAFRAFVALPVPAEPPLVALVEELGGLRADLKPVDPGHLHLTLSFLGQVEDDAAPVIGEAIVEATRGVPAFDLELRTVGAFPSARRPRVLWAGVADPRPISALATRVREALLARGLPRDDKDFRAHLTLARVRSERGADEVAGWLKRHGRDELTSVPAREIHLYESRLAPTGPSYVVRATARLEA